MHLTSTHGAMARNVLAVLLLLARGPEDSLGVAYNTRNCSANKTLLHRGSETMIGTKNIQGNKWPQSIHAYVVPGEGFEGVRAELEHDEGILKVWLPNKNQCNLDDSHWWHLILEVEKTSNSLITLTLKVNECKLTCEVSIGPKYGRRDLKLWNLKLFGRGPSWWRKRRPKHCGVGEVSSRHYSTLSTCTKPPRHGDHYTPYHNKGHNPRQPPTTTATTLPSTTLTTPPATSTASSEFPAATKNGSLTLGEVAAVVFMAVGGILIVAVMVFAMVMRHRRRQENAEEPHVTEPELRVTRNSLYEAFDSSTPGHGGAIQVIRNSLYEPFDKYQQQSDTAGHGGDTHY